jgi:hypothetical protein
LKQVCACLWVPDDLILLQRDWRFA